MKLTQYDYYTLAIVLTLTLLVLGVLSTGILPLAFGTYWPVPAGWWVGAMMVWAWGKVYNREV